MSNKDKLSYEDLKKEIEEKGDQYYIDLEAKLREEGVIVVPSKELAYDFLVPFKEAHPELEERNLPREATKAWFKRNNYTPKRELDGKDMAEVGTEFMFCIALHKIQTGVYYDNELRK